MNTLNKLPVVFASALVLLSASCRVFSPGPDPCVVFGLEECDRMATQQACERTGRSNSDCSLLASQYSWKELAGPPDEEQPLEVIVQPESSPATPPTLEPTPKPAADYSDPEYFMQELKSALETADYEAADKLLVPDSMGDYPFGAYAYWYEGIGYSHREALDWFQDYAPEVRVVDISDKGGELYSLLADPKPEFDLIALAQSDERQEPSFLLISWRDGRYWWSGFLSVSCKLGLSGASGLEAAKLFCQEVGMGRDEATAPSEPLNTYDPSSVIDWISYAIREDPSVFEDLVGEQGADFAPYVTEYVSPRYDNGEEVAELLSRVVVDPELACVGYVEEDFQTHEGTGRWREMKVVFDGIDMSPIRLPSDTDYAQFLFFLADSTPGYVLTGISPIEGWGVAYETSDLSPCP